MRLEIKNGSENYAATIVRIKSIFDIEGADRIKRTVVFGNNVIISNDVKEGDLMVYFNSGTKLNPEFCKYNDLLTDAEQNRNKKAGYISHKQFRVKALKIRGVISDGILLPLNSLSSVLNPSDGYYHDYQDVLKEGDAFTDIDGVSICEKYIVPVRNSNPGGSAPKNKKVKLQELLVESQFRFHSSTEHFVKNQNKFSSETEIIITRKLHGSSLILANVLLHKQLTLKEKIFKFFGANISTTEYGMVWSSGKPKSQIPKGAESESNKWTTNNPSYYTEDIWKRAYNEIGHAIEKGISIYAEIVGKGVQGDLFTYNQEYGIYIYRITSTSVDGHVVEFSWEQIKRYCVKYGLNHVEEYFVGKVKELASEENLLGYLQEKYLNKSYPDCSIDEGVVIRIRESDELFKLKSSNFILMESNNQEQGIVDIEESSDDI